MNELNWLWNFLTATLSVGESMLPTLQKFSLVKTKKMGSYQIGDIILLKTHDKKLHMHRITNYDFIYETVSTKGDNLEQQSYEIDVPFKNIKGKLIWYIPKGKS